MDDPSPPDEAVLPGVLRFLSSFPQYLDIVVQCTRKTEVRSWRTLFAYLPPPAELFEESLARGALKTAGGYLLVLHTFEELSSSSEQLIRLLRRAKDGGDYELCKELARFLVALDGSGETLREAMELVDLRSPVEDRGHHSFLFNGSRLKPRRSRHNRSAPAGLGIFASSAANSSASSIVSGSRSPSRSPGNEYGDKEKDEGKDYFSIS